MFFLDWSSECPTAPPVKQVKITYSVPHINNSLNNIVDVCVSITGPTDLLSPASEEKKCNDLLVHHVSKLKIPNCYGCEYCLYF